MSISPGLLAAPPRPDTPSLPDDRFALLGAVTGVEVVGSTLVVDCGGPRRAVSFLADDLLRVRLAPTGDFRLAGHGADADATPFSYALDPVHQSRWNYHDEGYARWVAHKFRRRELPLDCIHLDIGHMDGYRVFTWDRDAFPDPVELNEDFAALGIRSVVIVDPGVFPYQASPWTPPRLP